MSANSTTIVHQAHISPFLSNYMYNAVESSETSQFHTLGYDVLPDPVFIFTSDMQLVYCNDAADVFSGFQMNEEHPRRLSELFGQQLAAKLIEEFNELLKAKKAKVLVICDEIAEPVRTLRLCMSIIPAEIPESPCIICQISDLSDHAGTSTPRFVQDSDETINDNFQAPRQLPADQKRFLTNMTHELRTPLNGIIGITELLDATSLDEHQREYTDIIQISCNTLLSIVNSILDFSNAENGTVQRRDDEFSPEEIIFDEVDAILPRVAAKQIELGLVTGKNMPGRCSSDVRHFRSILGKLLDNAVKFTETGSIFVQAVFFTGEKTGPSMQITITDTGIGIPPEKQCHLFTPFYQIDNSAIRKFGGIGIGLALSQRLVRLLGGQIQFCSSPGTGSSFSFTIPITLARNDHQAPIPRFDGMRVLCIGVPYPTTEMLKHYFTDTGAETDCHSLDEILHESILPQNFGLLIIDESIPREKMLHSIARCRNGSSRTILLSSKPVDTVPVPFDGTLRKPFKRSLLYTLVNTLHTPEATSS